MSRRHLSSLGIVAVLLGVLLTACRTGAEGSPAASTTTSPSGTATSMRPLPTSLHGETVDDVSDVSRIVVGAKASARMPITRIVFDENVPASDYASAVSRLQPVSYLMGELLDSSAVSGYSTSQYAARTSEYLNAFGSSIDLWEIGNEVNGEWLGSTSATVAKITDAYNQVKAAGKRAALTLYYNPDCWDTPDHEMFAWAQKNVPAALKAGLDYVFISYYEQDCNNYRPTQTQWQTVFDQLHSLFPVAKLGFGEVGTHPRSTLAYKTATLQRYYGLRISTPGYVGGYFWWYFYEDCLPYTSKPLWQTWNTAIQGY